MTSSSSRSSLGPLLAVALVALALWALARRPAPPDGVAAGDAQDCPVAVAPDGTCPARPAAPSVPTPTAPAVTVLDAAEVCPTAGYLCQGFEERGMRRVLRWADDTPVIEVRIPRPPHEPSDVALLMQQAALRGIRLWHGSPFPVRAVLSDRPGEEDFAVRWVRVLGGRQLGHAESRWIRRDGVETIEVRELALSTRNPDDPGRTLDPRQVSLTASHEMGHALGLPHSDSERDVMYPTNTAPSPSARDFRTLQALYSLENGAEIRGGG